MKKFNVKRVMLVVAIFAAICVVSSISNATGDINELIQNITRIDSDPVPTTTNDTNLTPLPTTNENVNTNTNTNINTNNNSSLPKTGVDDTMLWVFIAVSVVAAGYTYKKVRDYNV